MALNARILSISEPVLPELLPSLSGSYDVFVLAKIISKSRFNSAHDSIASNKIDSLSPSMYGSSKSTFSESQLPSSNAKFKLL